MNADKGYIYVRRSHESYDIDGVRKLGKTYNIPERDSQYATGELKRGCFEVVYEVPKERVGIIEKLLQMEFCELNVKYDAGVEFYDKKIIELIEPYLNTLRLIYRKLSKEEISMLVRCNRVKDTVKKINKNDMIQLLTTSKKTINNNIISKLLEPEKTNNQIVSYTPRQDQIEIIEKSVAHFTDHDKGLLTLICGVGKTLISLWISQALNSRSILIGVPNKLLLKQWEKIVKILFQDIHCLIVSSGVSIEIIKSFLENNQKKCIVITTYASSCRVNRASQQCHFVFDMKINDEVHHLTSSNMAISNNTKKYIEMLKISSVKQLSLTATIKQVENNYDDDNIVSNDNVKQFGEIIERRCLLWAINENIVCDYDILTLVTDEEEIESKLSKFNITEENDKRLFLSAYATLKSIYEGFSHHLLIYSNNKENSIKLIQFIELLLKHGYFYIPETELYKSEYHSEIVPREQKQIINKFEKSKYGIITCVYCLGEGWDFPLLDGVVFSENMTSNIRIVQAALRASRKNKNEINKKTKILLPILVRDEWIENNENPDLKKVREVIYQMGLEDETICQKVKVFHMEIEKHEPKLKDRERVKMVEGFGEYDEELTKKLRLKTTKRTSMAITYEKARKIIAGKNIKTKEEYYELCDKDNRLSKEPDEIFQGQFTNWIDYLSIERVYYDLETCKSKVREYLMSNPDIKRHYLNLSLIVTELCKMNEMFPPNGLWVEYYEVKGLNEIIVINPKKKRNGISL
jgi:superfamily II DNA or RNA helicase